MVCRGGIGVGFRAAVGRTKKNVPFLDRKKKRFQLKSYSILNANNPYMVVASLDFVLRINSPRSFSLSLHRSRGGVVENASASARGPAEDIESLLHRCDASPERGETTRREETSPEVAAPDGDVGARW